MFVESRPNFFPATSVVQLGRPALRATGIAGDRVEVRLHDRGHRAVHQLDVRFLAESLRQLLRRKRQRPHPEATFRQARADPADHGGAAAAAGGRAPVSACSTAGRGGRSAPPRPVSSAVRPRQLRRLGRGPASATPVPAPRPSRYTHRHLARSLATAARARSSCDGRLRKLRQAAARSSPNRSSTCAPATLAAIAIHGQRRATAAAAEIRRSVASSPLRLACERLAQPAGRLRSRSAPTVSAIRKKPSPAGPKALPGQHDRAGLLQGAPRERGRGQTRRAAPPRGTSPPWAPPARSPTLPQRRHGGVPPPLELRPDRRDQRLAPGPAPPHPPSAPPGTARCPRTTSPG